MEFLIKNQVWLFFFFVQRSGAAEADRNKERGGSIEKAAIYCSAKSGARVSHRVMLLCMAHSNLIIKSSASLQLKRLLIDPFG